MTCSTCPLRRYHVQLVGDCLKDVTAYTVKKYLEECAVVVKPLHVIKRETNSIALVHFASEVDAATFFHVYKVQQSSICPRLGGVKTNPSLMNDRAVVYTTFQVQPRISSSTGVLCRCGHSNEAGATATATATTATTTANTTAATDNTTAATEDGSTSAFDDDDEVDADVHELKLKLTNSLKREQRKMEILALRITKKLRKKIKHPEDFERL